MLAEDAADPTDHSGPVIVPADEEPPVGHEVDAEGVDAHRARLAHQDGARDLVLLHAHGNQARVAAVWPAAALDQANAATACDETRVDRVDPLLGEGLQEPFDGGRHEQVDVVLGELSLEVQLDRADAGAEELPVQRGEPLGQVGEGAQVGELLRRQRRSVDSKAWEIAGEDGGHLLGHVERHRCLRLDRRRSDVRRRDEVGQGEQRALYWRLALEDVRRRGGDPA